jgi:hypothetical protein
MRRADVEIGLDPHCDAVLNFNFEKIGTTNALIAVNCDVRLGS